jgi:hypothetical protein
MDSPAGYLAIAGVAIVAALALVRAFRRRVRSRRRAVQSRQFDLGFPGLAEFAVAHGWSGPRDDLRLDRDEMATVCELLDRDGAHISLTYACTGHYRGMSILVGNALVTTVDDTELRVGVVVVTLPYLLPRRHSVQAAPDVAAAIRRRDDWAVEFASGRLTCVRHSDFASVAELARTLDALADVVNAVPADLVARFTVVLPRLPDGRLSDPHDAESVGDALDQMTPAQRAAFLDQMRGLRRSKPR